MDLPLEGQPEQEPFDRVTTKKTDLRRVRTPGQNVSLL